MTADTDPPLTADEVRAAKRIVADTRAALEAEIPQPCWELEAGWCASRANGRPRCRKGTCFLTEPDNHTYRETGK